MVDRVNPHRIEVYLRDARHMDILMALDRLLILPETDEALQNAMSDLDLVKKFISQRLPDDLKGLAKDIFIEHARIIESHFRAVKAL